MKRWRGSKRRSSRTASRRPRGRRSPKCCAVVRPTTASSPIRSNSAFALAPHPDCIESYLAAFFKKDGEPRGIGKTRIVTSGLAKCEPQLLARMEAERDRLVTLVEKRKAAAAAERSLALHVLGDAILGEYEHAKRRRGLLDYDDLIEGARRLLHRSSPSWVLYKLDAQIDHILLDEAQDTSSAQWDILAAIADEFCAGASAREARGGPPRSFFAVGDEKQSIFSFQGAAPERFDAMRREFRRRFEGVERRFEEVRLTQSFRSSPGVLQAVDDIFAIERESPRPVLRSAGAGAKARGVEIRRRGAHRNLGADRRRKSAGPERLAPAARLCRRERPQ